MYHLSSPGSYCQAQHSAFGCESVHPQAVVSCDVPSIYKWLFSIVLVDMKSTKMLLLAQAPCTCKVQKQGCAGTAIAWFNGPDALKK